MKAAAINTSAAATAFLLRFDVVTSAASRDVDACLFETADSRKLLERVAPS